MVPVVEVRITSKKKSKKPDKVQKHERLYSNTINSEGRERRTEERHELTESPNTQYETIQKAGAKHASITIPQCKAT